LYRNYSNTRFKYAPTRYSPVSVAISVSVNLGSDEYALHCAGCTCLVCLLPITAHDPLSRGSVPARPVFSPPASPGEGHRIANPRLEFSDSTAVVWRSMGAFATVSATSRLIPCSKNIIPTTSAAAVTCGLGGGTTTAGGPPPSSRPDECPRFRAAGRGNRCDTVFRRSTVPSPDGEEWTRCLRTTCESFLGCGNGSKLPLCIKAPKFPHLCKYPLDCAKTSHFFLPSHPDRSLRRDFRVCGNRRHSGG
jgi:hypothetical protein